MSVSIVLLLLLAPMFAWLAWYAGFLVWYRWRSHGLRYFSQPQAVREQFARQLQWHGRVLLPVLRQMAAHQQLAMPPTRFLHGTAFPAATVTADSLETALHYTPTADDIVVVTFMKAGTSWLQQIVFEILYHGNGDLSDNGWRHMYAASPWLETGSCASVSLAQAPLLGDYRKRLIKTHLPASLCPHNPAARYLCLVRDPADCFASCRDFLQLLMGPFCPAPAALLDWYLSDAMWWGNWPAHVGGWWQQAQSADNVLFLSYRELCQSPRPMIMQIAGFLGIPLTEQACSQVMHKSSLAYMTQHQQQFSMAPPTLFSASRPQGFIAARKRQPEPEVDERIRGYCTARLSGTGVPLAQIIGAY